MPENLILRFGHSNFRHYQSDQNAPLYELNALIMTIPIVLKIYLVIIVSICDSVENLKTLIIGMIKVIHSFTFKKRETEQHFLFLLWFTFHGQRYQKTKLYIFWYDDIWQPCPQPHCNCMISWFVIAAITTDVLYLYFKSARMCMTMIKIENKISRTSCWNVPGHVVIRLWTMDILLGCPHSHCYRESLAL